MIVESMQSLAGGTGKTTVVMESALESKADDARVLVIDTNQCDCLQKSLNKFDFETIGDVRDLFLPPSQNTWGEKALPKLAIICMPLDICDQLATEPVIAKSQNTLANAKGNLNKLAPYYDRCFIDCVRFEEGLSEVITAISDIVAFFPRRLPPASTEKWKSKYWDILAAKDRPTVYVESDRGEWYTDWIDKLLRENGGLQFQI